ncbi:hypothetical protein CDL12_25942 [Handroanthus impetiginosus]|uniref:Myb/SANT-like domain-containing protein n=1 Tax=Handroanthus impetiginosus TaxID=429701 RepID=A0A2G9G8C5_9LAMI|nr:hypothetical protein CDL12_25942 [Handroanthus impetiginosus]
MKMSGCSSRSMSKKGKLPQKPKRYWTLHEEEDLINDGYMVRLESMIAEKLPSTGIWVMHIKSKLQVWKKAYEHLFGILGSSGGASASLDLSTNMIICELESVWGDYIKVHSDAAKFQERPLPWFNSWGAGIGVGDAINELIYGYRSKSTDRSGDDIFIAADTTISMFEDDPFKEATSNTPPVGTKTHTKSSVSLGKRKRFEPSIEMIDSMVGKWIDGASSALGNLVDRLAQCLMTVSTHPESMYALKLELFDTIGELDNISSEEQIRATHQLVHSKGNMATFFSMHKEGKAQFVRLLLSGGLG